VNNLLPRHT